MPRSINSGKRTLSCDWMSMVRDSQIQEEEETRSNLIGGIPEHSDLQFLTGSTYHGKINKLGMAVYGKYHFVIGCQYEGGFDDGMFHGEGTLMYPMGQKLEGYWEKGRMIAYKFTNVDGLDYEPSWQYCTMPDRRFNISIREGLMPAGRELMTNEQPERPLDANCYDTGDGFYNPKTRSVVVSRHPDNYADLSQEDLVLVENEAGDFWANAVGMVSESRHDWIIKHCRKGWDEPAGYRPEFYEDWITGRRKELEDLERKYNPQSDTPETSSDSQNRKSSFETSTASMAEYAGTGRKLQLQPSDSKITGTPGGH